MRRSGSGAFAKNSNERPRRDLGAQASTPGRPDLKAGVFTGERSGPGTNMHTATGKRAYSGAQTSCTEHPGPDMRTHTHTVERADSGENASTFGRPDIEVCTPADNASFCKKTSTFLVFSIVLLLLYNNIS